MCPLHPLRSCRYWAVKELRPQALRLPCLPETSATRAAPPRSLRRPLFRPEAPPPLVLLPGSSVPAHSDPPRPGAGSPQSTVSRRPLVLLGKLALLPSPARGSQAQGASPSLAFHSHRSSLRTGAVCSPCSSGTRAGPGTLQVLRKRLRGGPGWGQRRLLSDRREAPAPVATEQPFLPSHPCVPLFQQLLPQQRIP